jgi:gliding motility-associated-like protein
MYQFSAWLANCMKNTACGGSPILPNFTFTIETVSGTVLASAVTPDLPITGFKDWVEYGVCYTTSSSAPSALVLRIKCNTGGPCGSSYVVDDVTFRAAGPSINVTVNGVNDLVIDLCMGYTDTYILNGTYSTSYIDPVLQWQSSLDSGRTWQNIPGATTDTYIIPHRDSAVIMYRLGVTERTNLGNANCIIFSETIWMDVHPLPHHVRLQQVLGCLNKDLTLTPSPFFLGYQWSGPNGFQSNSPLPVLQNLQNTDAGLYTVVLMADFGCSVTDSFQLNIFPSTTISTATLYTICEGSSVNLSATGNGTYEWIPATGLSNAFIPNPVASPRDSIEYKVVLTNMFGCKDSAQVVINVYKKVVVNAGPDKVILVGDTALLNGFVKGTAVNYSWSPNNTLNDLTLLEPNAFPLQETIYTLNAVSTVGCGNASDNVTVRVYKDVLMPNAFTPNKDGLNDVFHVLPLENYELMSFNIYTRWGSRIFSTTNANIGWDGTMKGVAQATGVYVYYLEMKSRSGKKITRKGTVLLIR